LRAVVATPFIQEAPVGRIASVLAVVVLCAASAVAQEVPASYQQVLDTLGKSGDFKDSVLKVNIPRNDVSVTVATAGPPSSGPTPTRRLPAMSQCSPMR
jgi:hypothetical protein